MDNGNEKPRKDRLIQTRVPQDLENTLKDEARKRRLSVSHLIRNVLEDTFDLVDNVVHEVDRVVADSVGVAHTLRRDAQRLAATARGETEHRKQRTARESDAGDAPSEEPRRPAPDAFQAAYAFQDLVLNRPAHCSGCGTRLARGERAYLGLGSPADAPRLWACEVCIERLGNVD